MAGEISLKIRADAGQAVKELAGVQKAGDRAGRTLEGVGRAKGKQGAEGVQGVNRELERLTKNADSASKKIRELESNLKRVGQQKGSLMGFVEAGAANPAQLKELEALRRYERSQSRSLGHWGQVAASRQEAADRAQGEQGPDQRRGLFGQLGAGFSKVAGGGIRSALPEGALGDLAGGLVSKFAGPLAMLGAGAAAAKFVSMAYDSAAKEQKLLADFLPRQGLGGRGFTGDPAASMGRLRDVGRPLGYSGYETLQIAGAMSTGGSKGLNLKSDTLAAAQFARVFGLDAGESATMLASGQQMGAFKTGDARKFANLLAREIAVTGLGPRSNEIQAQTLSLLNQQFQNSGQTNPAMIAALQSVLAKTGISALQGAAGGNLLARMNQAVTNPGSDAHEAIFYGAYRELGLKSHPAMLRAREQGIAFPGLVAQVVRDMEKQLSPDLVQEAMKEVFGVPMNVSAAWQAKAPGHHISNMLRGKSFEQIEKMLQMPGLLDKEAEKLKRLPGSQLRRGEATGADFVARIGTPIVKGAGTLADRASRAYDNIERIATADEKLGAKADRLYEFLTGAKPGSVHAVDKMDHAVARFQHSPWAKSVLGASAEEHRTGAMPIEGYTYNPRTRRYDPKPRHAPPTLPPVPGSGAPQMPSDVRIRENRGTLHVHHHHTITEDGVVSDASKHALRRAIREVVHTEHNHGVMDAPKSSYRGMH